MKNQPEISQKHAWFSRMTTLRDRCDEQCARGKYDATTTLTMSPPLDLLANSLLMSDCGVAVAIKTQNRLKVTLLNEES
jgi:hypothetical protein